MGLFGSILQAAVDVISLPVDVATDVVGLTKNATKKKVSDIGDEVEDVLAGGDGNLL